MINHKIRKAIKEDVKDILKLLIELAIFEKEPDAVKITKEELDGFRDSPEEYLFERFGGGNFKLNFYSQLFSDLKALQSL